MGKTKPDKGKGWYVYTMHRELWPNVREELVKRNLYFETSAYFDWGVTVAVECTMHEAEEIEKTI